MTSEFKEAKRKRRRRIKRLQNGSNRERKLASKLASCRPKDRRGCAECAVCELLEQRRQTRAPRAAEAGLRPPQQAAPSGIATRASDIPPDAVRWVWRDRFAEAKLSVVAGHPGMGKSQLAAFLAATISTGGQWPDGATASPGSVVMVIAEDGAADTVVPRQRPRTPTFRRSKSSILTGLSPAGVRWTIYRTRKGWQILKRRFATFRMCGS